MTAKTTDMSKPCRGVIVADACDLTVLSSPIAEEHKTRFSPLDNLINPTVTYLDMLPLLAQRGWRIILPETVMKEGSKLLYDGTDLSAGFFIKHKYPTEYAVRQFCMAAIGGAYPGIEIAAAARGTEYGDYIRALHDAAHIKPGAHDKTSIEIIRNHALTNTEAVYKSKKEDYGDMHCCDVITEEVQRQRKAKTHVPIFLLSSDNGARERLKTSLKRREGDPEVNVLAANGLLAALESDKAAQSSVLQEFGLSGPGTQHWQNIRKNGTTHKMPDHLISPSGYHDSPLAAYNTGRFPFAEAVAGMAAELVQERQQKEAEAANAPRQQNPLDKFKARLAKTAEEKAKRDNGGGTPGNR